MFFYVSDAFGTPRLNSQRQSGELSAHARCNTGGTGGTLVSGTGKENGRGQSTASSSCEAVGLKSQVPATEAA